ncbi:hypothetical protein BDZ89DRAFT_1114160 [Hymenopellis radicata]|nr:hypothetical protein BDZ89DRAFT_1114160 [Hymenopellis radicata]
MRGSSEQNNANVTTARTRVIPATPLSATPASTLGFPLNSLGPSYITDEIGDDGGARFYAAVDESDSLWRNGIRVVCLGLGLRSDIVRRRTQSLRAPRIPRMEYTAILEIGGVRFGARGRNINGGSKPVFVQYKDPVQVTEVIANESESRKEKVDTEDLRSISMKWNERLEPEHHARGRVEPGI